MLGWTYAIFLAGVVAIAGPILAHLFNRTRYRRVPFTMLAFLQLSEKQTQSRRRLREFLVLLMRCAIILLIVMAFAGPVLKRIVALERSFDQHVVVLDNSLSMTRTHGRDKAWSDMLDAARSYLQTHDRPENLFTLQCTQSGPLASLVPAEVAASQLDRMQPCPGDAQPQTLIASLQQIRQQMGRDDRLGLHIISDFTDHMRTTWLEAVAATEVDHVTFDLIAPHPETRNLAVTDMQVLDLCDNQLSLGLTVANTGLVPAKGVTQAHTDTQDSQEILVDLSPGQRATYPVALDVSDLRHEPCLLLEATITPDDDIKADNAYRLALSLQEQSRLNALLVGPAPTTFLMKTALEALSHGQRGLALNLQCMDFDQLDRDALQAADTLVFSRLDPILRSHITTLKQRVTQGARMVVFQGPNSDLRTAERLFADGLLAALPVQEILQPAHIDPLDAGAMPAWSTPQEQEMLTVLQQYALDRTGLWHYSTCQPAARSQSLWRISDQAHLIRWQPVETGRVIWINTSMDDSYSALTKGSAMPALARWLLGMKQPLTTYAFAASEAVTVPTSCFGRIPDPHNVGFIHEGGQRVAGRVTGSSVLCPGPHPLGWMRTVSDPVTYLGIHPVDNELQMSRPDSDWVRSQLKNIFSITDSDENPTALTASTQEQALGLEKWFLWLALALMLTDALVTNRMQR